MIGALLLASAAAVPAMAQEQPQGWHQNGGDRGGDRGGHEDHGGARPPAGAVPQGRAPDRPSVQRPDGPRPNGAGPAGQRPDFERPDRPQGGFDRSPGAEPRGDAPDGAHRVYGRPDNGVQVWRNDRGTAPRPDWSNRPNDRAPGSWDQGHDRRPGGGADRAGDWGHDRQGWNGNRPGGDRGGWNNGWRNDRRYDWRGWRDTHRDAFRAGRYRAPYGYGGGYRRWGVGVRIDPIFFGQDYWIGNPGYYRLPPAYGSYRWVRYYNDALLVDVYTGTVIDEIPNFFW